MQPKSMPSTAFPRTCWPITRDEPLPPAADTARDCSPRRRDDGTSPRTAGPGVPWLAEGGACDGQRRPRPRLRRRTAGKQCSSCPARAQSKTPLRHLLLGLGLAATAFISTVVLQAEPQDRPSSFSIVYVVRHAERADDGMAEPSAAMTSTKDPDLSAEGRARARRLASMLRDAGITRVLATEYRRTRQTAEPLASSAGVEIETTPASDVSALVARVAAHRSPLLIIGHSNTVPDILQALGIEDVIRLADEEYDNLFVVVRSSTGPPVLARLRY